MNFIEDLNINGHLTISKRYNQGEEEVIFDDHNIIVSGMGVGLSYLFTASGSDTITDYQIDRVQLGVGGPPGPGETVEIYELVDNLSSLNEYGTGSNINLEERQQITNGSLTTPRPFALIPSSKWSRVGDSSVRYTIVLDEEACNNITRLERLAPLNEIGLFMKNPTGNQDAKPILVAYRTFSDIVKTNDFSLIFRWTINW